MPVFVSRLFRLSLIALLFVGCAQVRTPTGGEKDELPPVLIVADPAPFSTSFSAERIVLEYDEYINLQGVRDQVVISPPMEERPEISLKNNKRITILFKEPLKENTTYTINFGEAISDYNEGNVLTENLFLFSTGTYIDSLQLSGRLLIAETDEPCAGCLALLHESMADTAVMTQKPYYLAKSDEAGLVTLPFLKEGEFRLYGLQDLDGDLEYSRGEALGFADLPVQVSYLDSTEHVVRLFVEEEEKLFMTGISPDEQKQSITITFSKDVDTLTFRPLADSPVPRAPIRFERRDSVELWFDPLISDAPISLEVTAGQQIVDTIDLRTDRRSLEFDSLLLTLSPLSHDSAAVILTSPTPIMDMDTSAISLIVDSVPLPFTLQRASAKSYSLTAAWEGGKTYHLSLYPAAVSPLVGMTNDSLEFDFIAPMSSQLSQLNVTVNDSTDVPLILRLVPEQVKKGLPSLFEQAIDGAGIYYFKKMPPGKYRLYLLYDENANGKWDTGEYLKQKQPERMKLHKEILQLRPNWELEVVFER